MIGTLTGQQFFYYKKYTDMFTLMKGIIPSSNVSMIDFPINE